MRYISLSHIPKLLLISDTFLNWTKFWHFSDQIGPKYKGSFAFLKKCMEGMNGG